MDAISEIIRPFTKDEIKEFKSFINRQKKKKNRKDLDLFNILLMYPEIKPDAAMKLLYKNENTEAYYALRKKLIRHITDFIQLKQLEVNADNSGTNGLISLAKYLFKNNTIHLAWKYLEKAEQSAMKNEEHDHLNQIYTIQIEHFENNLAPVLTDIIRKSEKNKKHVEQNEKANIAFSIIKEKLRQVKLSGKPVDFEKLIRDILKRYQLTNVFYSRPKLFFQAMSIFRSRIVAEKDYNSFEEFIIGHFQKFSKKTGFGPGDNYYKASLLYMIAHTLYRNKKFSGSLMYLHELEDTFKNMTKTDYAYFYPRYLLLHASDNFFTGRITHSVKSLQENISVLSAKLNQSDLLNMQVNLAFFFLYDSNPSAANKALLEIFHSNKWLEKIMGIEWVVKKEMLWVLVQFDLGNDDIAMNRIKSIERSYDNISTLESFNRIKTFIDLVKAIIEHPDYATSEALYNRVELSFTWVPFEREDLHAFLYYAWLKAKMAEKQPYEVLIGLFKT